MAHKLVNLDVNPKLITSIGDCLVNPSQTVRYQTELSSSRSISTGSPQGTVLSPVLFTLYTSDCTGTRTTLVIKYSDDTAIEGSSNSDSVYFAAVERFRTWCKDNWLDLSVIKTKVDLRKKALAAPDLHIDGVKYERVIEYKYFNTNTNFIHKKCQPKVFCL